MLTDVIERISASCVPSAIASGTSPMSQFKSILSSPVFIPESNPRTREVVPVLLAGLAPAPSRPVQTDSHRVAEAAPGFENPPNSRCQCSDLRLWFAGQQ